MWLQKWRKKNGKNSDSGGCVRKFSLIQIRKIKNYELRWKKEIKCEIVFDFERAVMSTEHICVDKAIYFQNTCIKMVYK